MCLAIPMKIIRLMPDNKAIVQRGGISIEADVSLLESPQPGNFTIVHAGFALELISDTEAVEQDDMLAEFHIPDYTEGTDKSADE